LPANDAETLVHKGQRRTGDNPQLIQSQSGGFSMTITSLALRRFARDYRVVIAILLVAVAGCSKGPDVVPVEGTLTRGGKPLASFAVTFLPTEGRHSVGFTDENGHFVLAYTMKEKGALRGKHKVFVQFNAIEATYDQPSKVGRPPDLKAIHEKYGSADVTPLEVEIDGPKTVDLKLD